MELNTFAEKLIAQFARIANSLEVIEGVVKSGKGVATSSTTTSAAVVTETATEKKKREAAEKKAADAAAAAAAAPKADRPAVNKALVALKDTVSKEAAQAVFKSFGYEAMSKIEDKDFDAVLAAAEKELEDFANKTGNYAEND